MYLFHQDHFLAEAYIFRLQTIDVGAAAYFPTVLIHTVPAGGDITGLLKTVNQRTNFLTQEVVNLKCNLRCLGQSKIDARGGIKGDRVEL